jgi:flagellar capping protein FliD
VVGKLISAGALWSSFYSFIDVKKVDDINETIREKFDAQAVSKVEDVKKSFEVELKRQAADANRIIEDLGAKYNELATKYNRLRGIK